MKSILISINPKWCEKICHIIGYEEDGTPIYEKGVEVRKTKPQCNTPIKVLIYCTMNGESLQMVNGVVQKVNETVIDLTKDSVIYDLNGKVIGEFVCDKIFDICIEMSKPDDLHGYPFQCTGLTDKEILQYLGNGKTGYGWHISDLVIYDKPRELNEFRKPCIYGDKDVSCFLCEKSGYAPDMHIDCFNTVTRPPQSWCYVEEVQI